LDKELVIEGTTVKPGSRSIVRVPVTTDLNGEAITLVVHAVAGRRPGPTLALLSTLHGSEWLSIEVIRRVVEGVDPNKLSGNILAVPVGNPVALQSLTRNTPDESDSPDLNRAFGGKFTWIAELLATTITRTVIQNCDYLIDYHLGPWGTSMGAVMYGIDYEDEELVGRCRDMAKAFGYPCIMQGRVVSVFPGPRSSLGYAGGVLGKTCIAVEIGGVGFEPDLEELWTKQNVDGTFNVMKQIGMVAGSPELPDRYLVWQKRARVNPTVGGYLRACLPPDLTLREVGKGDLMARVMSPYTFETMEELRSPTDGYVFFTCRDYPVRPGDWAYGVIDKSDSATRWVGCDDL